MKILLVEDDDDVRKTLTRSLEEEGFSVECEVNGLEGLYRAENWDFDIIILDVMLPEADGWAVLKKLRRTKATPVLMLTALGQLDDRIYGLNNGADDYMAKPYETPELIARVRALARRSMGMAENIIDLGRVIIDVSSYGITLDGEPVKLTAGQFKIVEHLARNAGKIISRDQLCEALLIEDEEAFSNVLDVQIYNIRKKLGKDFLQNRRGVGYIIPKP
ncbi:response regulator transcription factor [Cerasicoccus frondis]|uniref:response regulator transcription factor n=1 Tax=Cerasicoccus frondis TaxID=490090 RepID=UPI0028524F92|nr:response regulator transcription factor [Cerasicoccus frondis]